MYFFPLSFDNLNISKNYQNEIPGQPLRNKLIQKRLYPVEIGLQLKTEERKQELRLQHPQNRARSYPYPEFVIKPLDRDKDIISTFYKNFNLEKPNVFEALNDFCYLGNTTRVRNQFKDGVKLDIQPKSIIASSISNPCNVSGFTPNFWNIPQSARHIPTNQLPDLKLLLTKNKETGQPNFLAFGEQVYNTLVEHSLNSPALRKAFRTYGFLPNTEQEPSSSDEDEKKPVLSEADKTLLWETTFPQLVLSILTPGSALSFSETKVAYLIRREFGNIDDAKVTYNISFLIPPIEGSELKGGLLQIPVAQYFVRLPFIWNEKEKDFEELDPTLVKSQAALLRKILIDSNYSQPVSCLFDISKEKKSEEPTKKQKTWEERRESDRKLWRDRYNAIEKDFFFPDWVLRLLQKVPTIGDLEVLPTDKEFARSNSTELSDSIFFSGLDQRDEKQLTSDEKLIGLALLFGLLDPERNLIMNTNVFRERSTLGVRFGPFRTTIKGLWEGITEWLKEKDCRNMEIDENLRFRQTIRKALEGSSCSNYSEEWDRLISSDRDTASQNPFESF